MLYHNYCTIKKFGTIYRATCCKHPLDISPGEIRVGGKRGSAKTDARFAQSLSRTRNRVFEIAACNPFDWFGTFTLDKKKYDRFDLPKFRKDFAQFLRDERKRTGAAINYLLIPEMHQDGAWHMHGLFFGIPENDLKPFSFSAPKRLWEGGYLNWPRYAKRFGFCSFGAIRDSAAVAGYVTKYIAKGIDLRSKDKDVHLFYASRGLERAEEYFSGELVDPARYLWTWEGEHSARMDTPHVADVLEIAEEIETWRRSCGWKAQNLR